MLGIVSDNWTLSALFFVAAVLYSSVGHAGASGYLAAMALAGVQPSIMKPTALVLNLIVGTIALVRFARAGYFSFRLFWPFALGSIPFAFIGGVVQLPGHSYRILVGIILFLAAARLAVESAATPAPQREPPQSCLRSRRGWGSGCYQVSLGPGAAFS